MRGLFPLCHCFFSFWHYGIAGQYMTTAIGGGFLSLNKNARRPWRALRNGFLLRITGLFTLRRLWRLGLRFG
jgi:hypothetical protein